MPRYISPDSSLLHCISVEKKERWKVTRGYHNSHYSCPQGLANTPWSATRAIEQRGAWQGKSTWSMLQVPIKFIM